MLWINKAFRLFDFGVDKLSMAFCKMEWVLRTEFVEAHCRDGTLWWFVAVYNPFGKTIDATISLQDGNNRDILRHLKYRRELLPEKPSCRWRSAPVCPERVLCYWNNIFPLGSPKVDKQLLLAYRLCRISSRFGFPAPIFDEFFDFSEDCSEHAVVSSESRRSASGVSAQGLRFWAWTIPSVAKETKAISNTGKNWIRRFFIFIWYKFS